MKYILFNRKKTDIGGLGHSLTDYLSSYIFSKIYNIPFIYEKFDVLINTKRYMDVQNTNDKYFWNEYLNFPQLEDNIVKINKDELKDYKYIPIDIGHKWRGFNINSLREFVETNNEKYENIVYYFVRNMRIYWFDLYYYELLNNNIKYSQEIYDELNRVFYLKHNRLEKDKKIINVYLRGGDLRKTLKKRKNFNVNYPFEKSTLFYIMELLDNIDNYVINVISAGNEQDLYDINNNFGNNKNINILFNKDEAEMFYLMSQSDILIYKESQYPQIASYYSNGLIIRKNDDEYNKCLCYYGNQDTKFFDNYLFINNIKEINDEKKMLIQKYL